MVCQPGLLESVVQELVVQESVVQESVVQESVVQESCLPPPAWLPKTPKLPSSSPLLLWERLET